VQRVEPRAHWAWPQVHWAPPPEVQRPQEMQPPATQPSEQMPWRSSSFGTEPGG
jgi:hypothetical protein